MLLKVGTALVTIILCVWLFVIYIEWGRDQNAALETQVILSDTASTGNPLLPPRYLTDTYNKVYISSLYYRARYL